MIGGDIGDGLEQVMKPFEDAADVIEICVGIGAFEEFFDFESVDAIGVHDAFDGGQDFGRGGIVVEEK